MAFFVASPETRFGRFLAFLRARPDSEHELTANRLFITTAVMTYLLVARHFGSTTAEDALVAGWTRVAAFGLASTALFAHLLWRPGVSHARRIIGLMCDVGIFSYGLHATDGIGAALFPIYFWIVLGNGFRFDRRYLALAAVTSAAAFAVVARTTPFWIANPVLDLGVLAGLIGIPAYASGLIRKLYEAKRQAEEASRAKSLFLASVSHELRTPLNAIIGLSNLLSQSDLDAEQQHMSRVIGRSGANLLGLIDSLLDFSRIEAGSAEVKTQTVDLPRLLRDIREIVGVAAQAKGVRVALHVTARTPHAIVTDRRHLEEILTNLAGNAVKFTACGHVCIRVDAVANGTGWRLRVEVADTGIGIAEEAQGRIFDSFTQADGTIIDRFGGTGLGLAIVRRLVRLHGGDISVASRLGIGSTFTFDMPVGAAEAEASETSPERPPIVALGARAAHIDGFADIVVCREIAEARTAISRLRTLGHRRPVVVVDTAVWRDQLEEIGHALIGDASTDEPCLVLLCDGTWVEYLSPALASLYVTTFTLADPSPLVLATEIAALAAPAPEAAAAPRLRDLSILVAEDNKTNQMVIAKILERAGHRPVIAENGEEAVDRMLAEDFDLVLMDINMPEMNGIEATRFYRFAALGRPRVPILALTADATAETERRCLEAGMDDCLTKPIEPDRLLATIEAVITRLRSEAAAPATPAEPARTEAAPEERPIDDSPIIDTGKLDDLENLGGREFVDELVAQFVGEATAILSSLSEAVAEDDVTAFRDRIHALRSGAANVGADRVYRLCLDWRATDARELAIEGEIRLRTLEEEFARVREAIERRAA